MHMVERTSTPQMSSDLYMQAVMYIFKKEKHFLKCVCGIYMAVIIWVYVHLGRVQHHMSSSTTLHFETGPFTEFGAY